MKSLRTTQGFSLVELIVAAGVFLVAIGGIVYSYLKCMQLEEIGRNSSIAVSAVKNKLEDIKNTPFATINATYSNTTFTTTGLNGRGVVYVAVSNPSLLWVKVVFCWKQQNGQLIGEDKNLNGVLNAGEDKDANGQIDSPVTMVTYIYG